MRLVWARERPTHVAHLIALDAESEWVVSEGMGKPLGDRTVAALRALGWRLPVKDDSIPPRYQSGYVGLCNIAFTPKQTDCIERRCKQCVAQLQQIAMAAG